LAPKKFGGTLKATKKVCGTLLATKKSLWVPFGTKKGSLSLYAASKQSGNSLLGRYSTKKLKKPKI
jgi:hypothetical protein